MIFATDKIRLRALEPEDLEWLYRMENDDTLWDCGRSNVPYSRYVLRSYIAEARHDVYADGQVRLAVVEQKGQSVVGCVDLVDFSPRHLRAEVGIAIFPKFRRQGYATAALRMLSGYARNYLHLRQLYAVVSGDNVGALQLFGQCGDDSSALLPDWLRKNDGTFAQAFLLRCGL